MSKLKLVQPLPFVPGVTREVAKREFKHVSDKDRCWCLVSNYLPENRPDMYDLDEYNESLGNTVMAYTYAKSELHFVTAILIDPNSKAPLWKILDVDDAKLPAIVKTDTSLAKLLEAQFGVSDIRPFVMPPVAHDDAMITSSSSSASVLEWKDGFPVFASDKTAITALKENGVTLRKSRAKLPSVGRDYDVLFCDPHSGEQDIMTLRFIESLNCWLAWIDKQTDLWSGQLFSCVSTAIALAPNRALTVLKRADVEPTEVDFRAPNSSKFRQLLSSVPESKKLEMEGYYDIRFVDDWDGKRVFVDIYAKEISMEEIEQISALNLISQEVQEMADGWQIVPHRTRTYSTLHDAIRLHFWRTQNVRPFRAAKPKEIALRPLYFGSTRKADFSCLLPEYTPPRAQFRESVALETRNKGCDQLGEFVQETLTKDGQLTSIPYVTGCSRNFNSLMAFFHYDGDQSVLEIPLVDEFADSVPKWAHQIHKISFGAVAQTPLRIRQLQWRTDKPWLWLTFPAAKSTQDLMKAYLSIVDHRMEAVEV